MTTTSRIRLAVDKTIDLEINGSRQKIRLCADRIGLPPLLVVQAGPALPLLHEVPKFQRLLNLEKDFLVGYWEQRGCGDASAADARSVSLSQQVADLRSVLQWLHAETQQRVLILAISVGATYALQAVEHEAERARAVIAISPDSQTAESDAASYAFLLEQARRAATRRLGRRVTQLGQPPYVDSAALRRRASLLADLGTIERGKTFGGLLRELLVALIRTYGFVGGVRALRNMNLVQHRLLPELAEIDLFAHPPRVTIPVHYIFGEQDALTTAAMANQLPAVIAAPASTFIRLPDAGHMVHFDQPDVVRTIAEQA